MEADILLRYSPENRHSIISACPIAKTLTELTQIQKEEREPPFIKGDVSRNLCVHLIGHT
jgi:hypothetical protein